MDLSGINFHNSVKLVLEDSLKCNSLLLIRLLYFLINKSSSLLSIILYLLFPKNFLNFLLFFTINFIGALILCIQLKHDSQ